MMFWDASAVVPLLVEEPESSSMLSVLEEDAVVLVWWGTTVECTSALSRREREGALQASEVQESLMRLRHLKSGWQEVLPSIALRDVAERLLRVHSLRAADSLQLAAAIIAAERDPTTLDMVSLDARLNDAAAREGFHVVSG